MKKQIFKLGDKVFDIRLGWGEVINDNWDELYPIQVKYKNGCTDSYTYNGVWSKDTKTPILSFTEYTLQGFSQERPKPQPKVGEMCVFWDDEDTDRRVVNKLQMIAGYVYYENETPWNNCITLDEFYKQQNN
jgi:hypothetical protein